MSFVFVSKEESVCIYLLSLYSSHFLFSYYYAVIGHSFPAHGQRSESGSFPGIGWFQCAIAGNSYIILQNVRMNKVFADLA